MREFSEIACQLSFYPLQTEEMIPNIDRVLELIKESGLNYETGSMSTIIRGKSADVYALLQTITDTMGMQDETGTLFTMHMTISNICGC